MRISPAQKHSRVERALFTNPIHIFLITIAIVCLECRTAIAFKPFTHIYLAEQCVKEAIRNNGEVEFREIDSAGRLTNNVIGRYKVRDDLFEAIQKYPDHFRSGLLGPDAYPDILTGQMMIHPASKKTKGETSHDLNPNGAGPDKWLTALWEAAYGNGPEPRLAEKAFVAGFFTHAAGDMYAHTYVNSFTGDAFNFTHDWKNALRHLTIELVIEERTPDTALSFSIDGIEEFILNEMVHGKRGTKLLNELLQGDNGQFSVPAYFSKLRDKLQKDVERYERLEPFEVTEKLRLQLPTEYKRAWIDDIDRGLKKWPRVSHQIAETLFCKRAGSPDHPDYDRIEQILVGDSQRPGYLLEHLLSMRGAPDFVGKGIFLGKLPGFLLDEVTKKPKDAFDKMKEILLDQFLVPTTGMTVAEFKELLKSGETRFDVIMDTNEFLSEGGERISLKRFHKEHLHLIDAKQGDGQVFDYTLFPPAYNATVMTKLLFLPQDEVNRLMQDLMRPYGGTAVTLEKPNVMLGFIETLDGSNQWKVNVPPPPEEKGQMVVAREERAYNRIFMSQKGDGSGQQWYWGFKPAKADGGISFFSPVANSPLLKAGVKVGDIITTVDGIRVGANATDIAEASSRSRTGLVKLTILRKGTTGELEFTVQLTPK